MYAALYLLARFTMYIGLLEQALGQPWGLVVKDKPTQFTNLLMQAQYTAATYDPLNCPCWPSCGSEWPHSLPSICEWPDQKADQVLQTGLYWYRQWSLITSPDIHHTQQCTSVSSIWFLSGAPQFPPTTHPSPPSSPASPNQIQGGNYFPCSQHENQYDKTFKEERFTHLWCYASKHVHYQISIYCHVYVRLITYQDAALILTQQ